MSMSYCKYSSSAFCLLNRRIRYFSDLDEDSTQDGTCKLTFDEVRCDRTGNIEMISIKEDTVSVKDEPMSDQEYVETSSCPPSPCSVADDTPRHYGKVVITSSERTV